MAISQRLLLETSDVFDGAAMGLRSPWEASLATSIPASASCRIC